MLTSQGSLPTSSRSGGRRSRGRIEPLPLFDDSPTVEHGSDAHAVLAPNTYEGLYAFHKYWGKKPVEPIRLLVCMLTDENDLVADPFVGSGAVGRETALLKRRFVGGDVNPFAAKLSSFLVSPCSQSHYSKEITLLEKKVRSAIDDSYGVHGRSITSHLLWRDDRIDQVWERVDGKRSRVERLPTDHDVNLFRTFENHGDIGTRELRLFDNGRINSKATLTWRDLFTGRALRNISLLRSAISEADHVARGALELTLTASIGQMSKMVFAISGRGKTTGRNSNRVEVGSWVIGYWRPETHFEINVWNCFASKATKLLKGLPRDAKQLNEADIRNADVHQLLGSLDDDSIALLVTDPPHGDRIPYLELSELWNATLGLESNFSNEIVVSNAKIRQKTTADYTSRMTSFFIDAAQKLKAGGVIALFFNSRHDDEWRFIREACGCAHLDFIGAFKMSYSATSVVQDNREGSMKNDFVLIFAKGELRADRITRLRNLPGWVDASPVLEKAR